MFIGDIKFGLNSLGWDDGRVVIGDWIVGVEEGGGEVNGGIIFVVLSCLVILVFVKIN